MAFQNRYQQDMSFQTLTNRNFTEDDCRYVDFQHSDVSGSIFTKADLRGAQFYNTNIAGCTFYGTRFEEAIGIRVAGPIGREGRMIYGVAYEGEPRILMGCWWGTASEAVEAVQKTYAGLGLDPKAYLAAIAWVSSF
jgi:hypothetical protein